MGRFDLTARRAAKREPAGFFRWLMPRLDPALAFSGWLDARTAPPPPETELTCDTLAEFTDPARPEAPWIIVTEFQTEPGADDLERLLEYMLRFRRERRATADPRLKYQVAGVLLNLTGPPQADLLAMPLPGMPEVGLVGRVVRRAVRDDDAAATLAGIASGTLSRSVLPWVALMRGSDSAAVLDEWKRLAELEPDPHVRLDYAVDALIFAELPGVWSEWKKALEDWTVRESQQVLEWKAEGRAEGRAEAEVNIRQADLLRVLEVLCGAKAPPEVTAAVQASTDPAQLAQWLDVALKVKSYDAFKAALAL